MIRSATLHARARERAGEQRDALHRAQVASGSRAPPRAPVPTEAQVAAQIPFNQSLIPVMEMCPTGDRIVIAIDLNGVSNFGPNAWTHQTC